MGEYRREDDVLRLYFVIDYNNTQQPTRTTTISPAPYRQTPPCTLVLSRCVLDSLQPHVVHTTHDTHKNTSHPVQTAASASDGAAITTLLAPRPHLTFLSLDRRGGRLRLSQPSRIPSRTNNSTHAPHGSGKKTPSKQHSTCCKTPSCSSGRHRSSSHGAHKGPGSRRPGHIS